MSKFWVCLVTQSPSNLSSTEKILQNCEITNHFAKVCLKQKNPIKPKPRVNKISYASSEAATFGTSATVEEDFIELDAKLRHQNLNDAKNDSEHDDMDNNCVAIISNSDILRAVEPVKMYIQLGNIETITVVSGSVCTINNRA